MNMISRIYKAFRGDSGIVTSDNTFATSDNGSQKRSDGFTNFLSMLGFKDKMTGYNFQASCQIHPNTLTSMYQGSGISKRIVDLIPNEMTREWFEVKGDKEGLIIAKLEEIDAKNKIRNMLRWSRLFGGAIAVMGIDDGQDLAMPLNENNVRSVEFLHIFDRTEVTWMPADIYNDPNNKKYGQPQIYTINPGDGRGQFIVHESRVLRLSGEALPNRALANNQYWGESILQICHDQIKNLDTSYGATANIIQDFIQTIVKMPNLVNMIARGDEDKVIRRLEILDQSRSVANTILVDGGEEYAKHASSVSGLDQLLDRFALALSCVTGIPYTFLMGQPPSGLQATGDSDIRMFYDRIKADQEDLLQPLLERLVRLIMISKRGPFGGREPKNWQIEFKPLWQMSETETASYRKTIAETDQIYISNGVLDPAEVAASRFGGDMYSPETVIDLEARENPEVPDGEQKDYEAEKASAKEKAQNAGE